MTTRPKSCELHHVAAVLRATPKSLRALLLAVDEAILSWRPEPDVWSIYEIIGHLLDADEHTFEGRIRWILEHPGGVIPQRRVQVAEQAQVAPDLFVLCDELARTRERRAQYVCCLTEEQLDVRARLDSSDEVRVADIVYEWAWHDAAHFQQIWNNIQRYLEPELSAPMRQTLTA